jgi:pheromone shutdown protein TraB
VGIVGAGRNRGSIVGLLASNPHGTKNGAVALLRHSWREISIPQRLLIASALAYGGVFMLLVAYGRPGLGVGEGFFVPVILAAAATSAAEGALAGVGALLLYELGIHHGGLAWSDFTHAPALTRLASYVAAGVVVGFLAQRFRRMLAQSLFVLEDLIELAHGRLEEIERIRTAPPRASLK